MRETFVSESFVWIYILYSPPDNRSLYFRVYRPPLHVRMYACIMRTDVRAYVGMYACVRVRLCHDTWQRVYIFACFLACLFARFLIFE